MPKFSANLGFLWPEYSLVDRVYAAAEAGFRAVECHWPFDINPGELKNALYQTGLPMLSINTLPGDLTKGEFGLSAVPGRELEAREYIDQAISYASEIDARYVHVMAGITEDNAAALETFQQNLSYAAEQGYKANVEILIEPINRVDRPGYYLYHTGQALDLIDLLRQSDIPDVVSLMFDCYHAQMTEGNLSGRLRQALRRTGHIQVASVPGRAEPDAGEINFPWLFNYIDDLGYDGFIGAEYQPRGSTSQGLEWYAPYRDGVNRAHVYKHFTQAALDAEYNNQKKVKKAAEHIAWYTETSQQTRMTMGSERELKYGPSKSETLDLFFPNGESGGPAARPIHVFFHGGYWRALHKNDFSYVANAFSGSNAICAVVNYSLVPDVTMDELVEQCRRAMIWIWQNIADFGGSPHRITVSGHSAGGHLVGMMMATDWTKYYHLCPADLVKGGVALSGLFDLEPIRLCFLNQSLKLDADSARLNSPMYLPNRNQSELVCYFGALEGAEYRWQSETLASKWKRTEAIALAGHDHFTIARELNDPGSEISKRVRRLMGM